jgi:hypothetical protein
MAVTSSPRNTLIRHLVALLAGVLSPALFGLLDASSILLEGVTLGPPARGRERSRGRSCSCSVLAPANGATTLLVSLGFLQTPGEMAVPMTGFVLLTVVGWVINRAAGMPMPLWWAGTECDTRRLLGPARTAAPLFSGPETPRRPG